MREYAPQIQLAETGGRSAATITNVAFDMVTGGRVYVSPAHRRVEPGGMLQLWTRDPYGEPELEFSSTSSVTGAEVFFTDDAGRPGSVRAILAQ
jgi:hypothetical protein